MAKSAPKVITLTVIGKPRELTFAEQVAMSRPAGREVFWPVPVPEYETDEAAAVRRRRNYFKALNESEALVTRIAGAVAGGYDLHVVIGPGTVLTGIPDVKIYANTINGQRLRELCEAATQVDVAIDAEDPREYVHADSV